MNTYKVLNKQTFSQGQHSIVPIRMEDRYDIMQWRNEQIYHLRQNKPLAKENQDRYFNEVVAKLFTQEQPNQVLFSYLEEERCIGYGGLVHINWDHKNAEISFVMKTVLQDDSFEKHWSTFLRLLERVAFYELDFHKIYTYSYNIRPKLYNALDKSGFINEAILKEHALIKGEYKSVLYHSKHNILHKVLLRKATLEDTKILFEWANEKKVRQNSINQNFIEWEEHLDWLKKKLNHASTEMFIAEWNNISVGQVRLDLINDWWEIDYSIGKKFRGKGLGKVLIKKIISDESFNKIRALVKPDNISSIKVFESLGFFKVATINKVGVELFKYQYIQSQ